MRAAGLCRPPRSGAGARSGGGSTGVGRKQVFWQRGAPPARAACEQAGRVASLFPKPPFVTGFGQRGRVRELGPDPQAQAAAAEEVGSAGRPRAPLCPRRRQRSEGGRGGGCLSAAVLPPGGAPRACGVPEDGAGWPPDRQPPLGLLQPLFPVPEDRAARCFCSSPFPLPGGLPPALLLPRPGLFFLWFKDKKVRFQVVPPRVPAARGDGGTGKPRRGGPAAFSPPGMWGLVFWFESVSTWGSLYMCACVYLIREEVIGFSVFKPSGLLAINLPLRLSLQTLPDTRGKPPAEFHTAPPAVLFEPQGLRAVPGAAGRGVSRGRPPGTHPWRAAPGLRERDPTAAPLPVGNWHLKFHLHL